MACGGAHVCAVTTAGAVVCMGYGERGQFGTGVMEGFSKTFKTAIDIPPAEAVAAGGEHTCALAGGVVYCFGHNEYGQIGDGTAGINLDRPTPLPVSLPEPVKAIVAGGFHFGGGHTCALTVSGQVWCWGADNGGQIGDGKSGFGVFTPKPFHVTAFPGVATALAAGGMHTCAIREGSHVYCWGQDVQGQIGDGKQGSGAMTTTPTLVDELPAQPLALAAGDAQTCAVFAGDAVGFGLAWCWGMGGFGAFGTGTPVMTAKPLVAFPQAPSKGVDMGAMHGCVIRATGDVSCAGLDDLGELGSGTPGPFEIHATPIDVDVHDAVAISTGSSTTCALRKGGVLSCWGDWFGPTPSVVQVP